MLQLHPSNPFYAGWLSVCAKEPYFCDAAAVEYGALALAAYRKRCGSMLRAITAFRIGHCTKPGPRAKATMLLAQAIHWRVKNPSKAPLRAPRLP